MIDSKTLDLFLVQMELEINRKDRWLNWMDNYLIENQLNDLISRLVIEHGEEYKNKCYSNGYFPEPNNKLKLLFDYVKKHGNVLYEEENDMFTTERYKYGGYDFVVIFGQGVIHRIF